MRTTVRLEDSLLEQARREETLTSLIEQGIRLVLAQSHPVRPRRRVTLPVCRTGGGALPGVDLNDSSALMDLMEGRR